MRPKPRPWPWKSVIGWFRQQDRVWRRTSKHCVALIRPQHNERFCRRQQAGVGRYYDAACGFGRHRARILGNWAEPAAAESPRAHTRHLGCSCCAPAAARPSRNQRALQSTTTRQWPIIPRDDRRPPRRRVIVAHLRRSATSSFYRGGGGSAALARHVAAAPVTSAARSSPCIIHAHQLHLRYWR